MTKRSTTEEFIEKARAIHGDKYDYSLVEYKTNHDKVKIICKNCGKVFEQKPNNHLSGHGCKYCVEERNEQYMLEHFGVKNVSYLPEIIKKRKETMLKRYGKTSYSKTDEYKKRIKNTSLKKYGKDHYLKTEEVMKKRKNTCLEKYGVECVLQAECIKNKIKQTNLERYGAENIYASEYGKQKIRETNLERYGVDYALKLPEIILKGYETKKLNGTFGKSKEEDRIFELLQEKFSEVKRQYRSELYSFHCDFYIQELDLYIEFQGFWTHGKHIFDKFSEKDLKTVSKWQQKANEGHKAYRMAIEVWTTYDPLKRKTAKENNLNWLEFFTIDQFMNWYEMINN